MKLLVVSNMYPGRWRASFGIFVAERVAAYRQAGVAVAVAANTDPRKGRTVPLKYLLLLIRASWKALRWRPDVVEAHYLHPTGVIGAVAAAIGRARLVVHAHGSDVFGAADPGWAERWAVKRASEVHANSEATAEAVRLRHPDAQVTAIPPGVDVGAFPPSLQPRPAVIGFVGTLADYKGPDVLVEALPHVAGAWTARITGEGPAADALHRQIDELGLAERITVTGFLDRHELPAFFHGLAVLAVPSRREAFGQVAVEALASGTPVVVTNVGGLASIPTDACGTVVPSDDPTALAAALDRWIDSRHDETPKRAAVERAAHYDIHLQAARTLDRYRHLAAVH